MAKVPYKTSHLRGANQVAAMSGAKRLQNEDNSRYAYSRNQKCSVGGGRYEIVECWTLRERVNGKIVTVEIQRGFEDAVKFVGNDNIIWK